MCQFTVTHVLFLIGLHNQLYLHSAGEKSAPMLFSVKETGP